MSASKSVQNPSSLLRRRAGALVRRVLFAAAFVTTAAGAAGCASSQASAMAPAPGEARGDVTGVVSVALADVELRSDQRAKAQAILGNIEVATRPGRAARLALLGALADGVERGAISTDVVEGLIEAVVVADAAAAPALQVAANELHALLDEDQRETFVDGLKSGVKSRGLDLVGPLDEMRELSDELDLAWQQKRAIRAVLKARFEPEKGKIKGSLSDARRRLRATAKAFESDTFDAGSLAFAEDRDGVRELFTRFPVAVIEAATATASAEQRAKLAGYLRARASEP